MKQYMQDKDYKKIIELTAPLAEHIITVETPDNPRALPAEELKKQVEKINASVETGESIEAAIEKNLSYMGAEDVLVVFGSLSFLGIAAKVLQERLTAQIADVFMEELKPYGVMVLIEAEHMCMTMRGIKKPGAKTVTVVTRGVFNEDEKLQNQFYRMLESR